MGERSERARGQAGPLPNSDVGQKPVLRPGQAVWWLYPSPRPPDTKPAACPGWGARGPDLPLLCVISAGGGCPLSGPQFPHL